MSSYFLRSRSIVRVALIAAILHSSLPASAQILDGFIAIPEGNATFHVGVNPVTNRIYASSQRGGIEDGIVTVIDGATNGVVATVAVGAVAEDIVANPMTNRIYVGSFRSQSVAVIDGSDNTVIATVSVPDFPFSIDVNPVTNRVYSRGLQSVSVIDGFTNAVIATIPVDGGARGLVVDSAANRVFVSDGSSGAVVVVDGETNTVIGAVPLAGALPRGMDVNPAAKRLYVAAEVDVMVVDTETLEVIATVPVQGFAMAVAFNPSTNRLYVRTEFGGVAVIDTLTNALVRTFAVSDDATNADIGVNPVTNALYVPIASLEALWVTQDPAPFGGRDFGIRVVPGGVQLTWTPGSREAGYSIHRWAGDGGDTVATIANLPQGTTSFVDRGPLTESAYNYALVSLDAGGSPMWVSDILGVRPNTQSTEHAPTDFTLRHVAHAYQQEQVGFGVEMSWQPPGNQAGYVLAANFPESERGIPLPADATRAIQVITEPSCFTLFAGVGEEAGNTHTLCAIPLKWAMENTPSIARQLTSPTGRKATSKRRAVRAAPQPRKQLKR